MAVFSHFHIVKEWIARQYYNFQDKAFESWHGIETVGVVENPNLVSKQAELIKHATAYQAVWSRNIRVLINETQKIAHPDIFIDIGSGKGKACFYASKYFCRVIGVEFSDALVEIAEKNKNNFRRENIEFIVGDAGQYDLPDFQSLIFLFNPFDDIVLERFLRRNLDTIRRHDCLIAYANDRQRKVLSQFEFDCVLEIHFVNYLYGKNLTE